MSSKGSVALCLALVFFTAPSSWAAKIALDPGHGGDDSGAVGCGLLEKSINIDVGLKLRTRLQQASQTVVMTRTGDTSVSLVARTNYANAQGADRFFSIHTNSAGVVATGIETFSHPQGSSASHDMRNKIQAEMIKAWPLTNRGNKTANFHVLRESSMPAALVELGFINNCQVDATYLGNGTRRTSAADAQLKALAQHLGFNASPAPSEGEARGVVFEDQGVGTEDMSVRVEGATVQVVSGPSVTTNETGAWVFTLSGGTYTLRASADGYLDATRTCTVENDTTAWCSIGLLPEPPADEPEEDEPVEDPIEDPEEDEEEGDEPGEEDPGEDERYDEDEDEEGEDDEEGDGDEEEPGPPFEQEEDEGGELVILPSAADGQLQGGCSSTTASSGAFLALLFAGLLALPRRRRRSSAAPFVGLLACAFALEAGAHEPGSGVEITHEHLEAPGFAQPLSTTKGALLERQELFRRADEGAVLQPVIAPDGTKLLFTAVEMRELFLVDLAQKGEAAQPRKLLEQKGAGWMPAFRDDGARVLVRPAGKPHRGEPFIELDEKGTFLGPRDEVPGLAVLAEEGRIYLRTHDRTLQVSSDEEDDRFFAPLLSPDGHWVAFSGVRTGLFLYRMSDGQLFWLGHGSSPRFAPQGDALVFERTADEGLVLTASDLFFVDLKAPLVIEQLTDTPELERTPSLTEDLRVVFSVDDVVYIAARKR